MFGYRCYFLGEDGKIKGAENIRCPSDTAALEEAERRLAAGEYPTIEIWQGRRCLGIVGASTIAGTAAATAAVQIARPPQTNAEDAHFSGTANDPAAR